MKTYYDLENYKNKTPTAVTTGTFDGVHPGHLKIINRLCESAKSINGESVIITFYPHPRIVLFPDDNNIRLLNTQKEKEQLLLQTGIDHLVVMPFTKEFSRLTSMEFVRNILVNTIHAKKLVIGYDHHFGRNREGSFAHLSEFGPMYGFDVEEIPAQDIDHVAVSSSKIRKSLETGNLDTANTFLGYNYSITGKVIKGKQLGRELGFPTANIYVGDKWKLIPQMGVYAVKVAIGKQKYNGMMNIGTNPTVENDNGIKLEVNILDFSGDLYNKEITVTFIKRIRDELKFDTLEELKNQITQDKHIVMQHL